ncbi:Isoprenylcysteine carboxylmethyltransferase family protein [Candidatus Hepatincolaceae symbiont of Richtersius coronifer]
MQQFFYKYRLFSARLLLSFLGVLGIFTQPLIYNTPYYPIALILGLTLIVIGIIGRIFSILFISAGKDKNLATTGIYSISRNPLYFFSFIAMVGVTVIYSSIFIAIFFILGFMIYYYFVIAYEENKLLDIFGENYQKYLNSSTPKFIPNFSLWRAQNYYHIYYKDVVKMIFDAMWFFIIGIAVFTILSLQSVGIIPVFFYIL